MLKVNTRMLGGWNAIGQIYIKSLPEADWFSSLSSGK
jgi:hypothetical protein